METFYAQQRGRLSHNGTQRSRALRQALLALHMMCALSLVSRERSVRQRPLSAERGPRGEDRHADQCNQCIEM